MPTSPDVRQFLEAYHKLSTHTQDQVDTLLVEFLATISNEAEKQTKLLELAKRIRSNQDPAFFPLVLSVFRSADHDTKTFLLQNPYWKKSLERYRDSNKNTGPSLVSLRLFWDGDKDFGLPPKYHSAKTNPSLMRDYQTFCNKIKHARLSKSHVWNREGTGMLDRACRVNNGYLSAVAIRKAIEGMKGGEPFKEESPSIQDMEPPPSHGQEPKQDYKQEPDNKREQDKSAALQTRTPLKEITNHARPKETLAQTPGVKIDPSFMKQDVYHQGPHRNPRLPLMSATLTPVQEDSESPWLSAAHKQNEAERNPARVALHESAIPEALGEEHATPSPTQGRHARPSLPDEPDTFDDLLSAPSPGSNTSSDVGRGKFGDFDAFDGHDDGDDGGYEDHQAFSLLEESFPEPRKNEKRPRTNEHEGDDDYTRVPSHHTTSQNVETGTTLVPRSEPELRSESAVNQRSRSRQSRRLTLLHDDLEGGQDGPSKRQRIDEPDPDPAVNDTLLPETLDEHSPAPEKTAAAMSSHTHPSTLAMEAARHSATSTLDNQWLNDDAIETILSVLESDRVQVRVLRKEHSSSVQRRNNVPRPWIRPTVNTVVMPVNHGHHWSMAVLDVWNSTIHHFDSMYESPSPQTKASENHVLEILGDLRRRNRVYLRAEPTFVHEVSSKQVNSDDCGVFCCLNAFRWILGRPYSLPDGSTGLWRRIFHSLIMTLSVDGGGDEDDGGAPAKKHAPFQFDDGADGNGLSPEKLRTRIEGGRDCLAMLNAIQCRSVSLHDNETRKRSDWMVEDGQLRLAAELADHADGENVVAAAGSSVYPLSSPERRRHELQHLLHASHEAELMYRRRLNSVKTVMDQVQPVMEQWETLLREAQARREAEQETRLEKLLPTLDPLLTQTLTALRRYKDARDDEKDGVLTQTRDVADGADALLLHLQRRKARCGRELLDILQELGPLLGSESKSLLDE